MQDTIINEDKDSPEPSDCCIPNCYDKVEVLDIEYIILTSLEDIAMGLYYHPYIRVHSETLSNFESNVKEALQKLKNYQKENCTLKQQLKKNEASEKVVSELKPQLEEKENEIKKLKIEISNQIEEKKDVT